MPKPSFTIAIAALAVACAGTAAYAAASFVPTAPEPQRVIAPLVTETPEATAAVVGSTSSRRSDDAGASPTQTPGAGSDSGRSENADDAYGESYRTEDHPAGRPSTVPGEDANDRADHDANDDNSGRGSGGGDDESGHGGDDESGHGGDGDSGHGGGGD